MGRPTLSSMNLENFPTRVANRVFRNKRSLKAGPLLKAMGPDTSASEIAAVLYIPERTAKKWIRRPRTKINPFDADTYANRIGKHPFQVWSWDWVDAP